jgi:quinoprotein glucose dehydrogenase
MPYTNETGYTPRGGFTDPVSGRPCFQPPWGELLAINANTGDIAWRVPLGTDEQMEAKGIMNTGTRNNGGTIVTAGGLVFIAATTDGMFRAFDAKTGKVLWATRTDGFVRANPMTFRTKNGKQMVLVYAAGGGGGPANATVIAYALP